MEHPISRLKLSEVVTDRPGRVYGSSGRVRHAMQQDEDPMVHAARVFAKEISETIGREFVQGSFDELVLVAEPAFMGKLMAALPKKICQQRLAGTVPKDFSHLSDTDVEDRLQPTLIYLWKDPRRWEPRGFAA
jgi:protein required for attachment to host cells